MFSYIAHFVTGIISNIFWCANLLTHESVSHISVVASKAIACIEVELSGVAQVVAGLISHLLCLTNRHTSEAFFCRA
jgi:hypothetical protein